MSNICALQTPHHFGLRGLVLIVAALCLPSSVANAGDVVLGFTEPFVTIDLAASETGTLSNLSVRRGDSVRADQLIGSLDNDVLQANRNIAQARLESVAKLNAANIRYARAKRNLEKLEEAQSEGFGGTREVEIAASELELAETDLEAVREEAGISELTVKRIDAEIRQRQLVSPITGVITKLHREVGEFVSVTEPHVVTIVDLKQLRIRFHPKSSQAETLTERQPVAVRLVHSNRVVRGQIEFIAPVIDADSDTLQVDVLLDNSKGNLRSGRRCLLELQHHIESNAVASGLTKAHSSQTTESRQ